MSRLSGWGRTAAVDAEVLEVTSEEQVAAALAAPLAPRGLGRSYGDAAQLAGGRVLDLRGLDAISPVDPHGAVTVGAGASLDALVRAVVPAGWFVPVTPGTRQVTLGGALAADVHGKNHHRDGTLGAHVTRLRVLSPTGIHELTPADGERFFVHLGALGLTGVITEATLDLLPISSDRVLVDTERFDDLDGVMAAMVEGDHRYRYSVAWVDCASRAGRGRAVLTRGDHERGEDRADATLRPPRPARLAVPVTAPPGLLNAASVAAFNELWFRRAPRHRVGEPQRLETFFHPLDGVRDWNRLYGPRGFVQYQFAVPDDAAETVRAAVARLAASRVPSFLAVLKRFGPANPAPLSFPQPGWTLALDLPVGPPALPGLLDALDEMVVAAGGRVYLAKDARLAPATVRAMYPRLPAFAALAALFDPEHRLTSDLDRRLRLREG